MVPLIQSINMSKLCRIDSVWSSFSKDGGKKIKMKKVGITVRRNSRAPSVCQKGIADRKQIDHQKEVVPILDHYQEWDISRFFTRKKILSFTSRVIILLFIYFFFVLLFSLIFWSMSDIPQDFNKDAHKLQILSFDFNFDFDFDFDLFLEF